MIPGDSIRPETESRRSFIRKTATAATAALAAIPPGRPGAAQAVADAADAATAGQPWFRRVLRWGQTNITERDPPRYDIAWWRAYWKRTRVQGVIVNAGGIVAYYPSRFPLHRRAQFLGDRDLFGDLARAAREEGLAVLARMDSNRAHEEFYRAHPDWFAVDASGKPHRAGDLFIACIHGPYYETWIPDLLREIVERYRPEGFTDNSWSGPGRGILCHCDYCRKRFRERSGRDLPREKDWDDPVWREWVSWNYARRLELWDFNNAVTRAAGGADCLWIGMNSGSMSAQGASFRDLKEIARRAPMLLLDHQARSDSAGFQQNGETGKLVHGLLGWDKVAPESMALYQAGTPTFRLSAKPAPEAHLWMLEGFAGGIQPWWHHVGAWHEDRRAYRTAEPLMRWHQANESYLVHRRPIAGVGLLWSGQNTDFHGRDDPELLVELPWRGVAQALVRARIPYLPVHADHLERDAAGLSLVILPNLAGATDRQIAAIRRFVENGGGLLATGDSTLFNEWGDPRPEYALADLFGARRGRSPGPGTDPVRRRRAAETQHTYLRLLPALNQAGEDAPGGGSPQERTAAAPGPRSRHTVLRGFEETDIVPFGGVLEPLAVDAGAVVPLTFVPAFPVYPPETAWMREPATDIPALILNERPGRGRVAFLPADIDRRFARDHLPDHGDLLTALVRWAARDAMPLDVQGAGLIDCHLYRQSDRLILHMVNLTHAGAWRQPVDELTPAGPFQVTVSLPAGVAGQRVRSLVSGRPLAARARRDAVRFEVKSVLDHEVLLIA